MNVDKEEAKEEAVTFKHNINDLVVVASRTWPGINKPGGVGRIKFRNVNECTNEADSVLITYTVAYVLGGKEENIKEEYIKAASNTIAPRERKQTVKYVEPVVEASPTKKRKSIPSKKQNTFSSSGSNVTAVNKEHKKKQSIPTAPICDTTASNESNSDDPPNKKMLLNDGYATDIYDPDFQMVESVADEVVVADHVYEIAVIIHHTATAKMTESGEDLILVQEVKDIIIPPSVDKEPNEHAMYTITDELFEEALQYLSDANKFMINGDMDEEGRCLILV